MPGIDGVYNEWLTNAPEAVKAVIFRYLLDIWKGAQPPEWMVTSLTMLQHKPGRDPTSIKNY